MVFGSLASSLRNFRGPLICTINRLGHSVSVVAPALLVDDDTRDWLSARGIQCYEVPLSRAGLSPVGDLAAVHALLKLLQVNKPDYFIGYTIKPVIWGIIAAWMARVPNRVALITGLGYAFTGDAKGKRALIQRIARELYRFALKRATLIFFQNPDDRTDFEHLGLLPRGVPVVIVNGSGVDTEEFAPVRYPGTPIRFLLIARLLGDKGVREYALAALQVRNEHPTAEFHLVGGLDPNPDSISEEEVRSWHDAGTIVWHGALPDVRPAIANSHVYVLPSYREGTPRTVLEAMAMGRPVITTDAPGCRETVEHNVNGFLVPVRDVHALVKSMEKFIVEPSIVEKMGRQSRIIAEQKYDVHKVNAEMIAAMGL